jgi:alpha-L-rhamnosidase
LEPSSIWTSPSGATLVDFGQNLVGWVRVRVRGGAGETIRLRHAEVLENGELGIRPLRSALATDHFTLSGHEDVFAPTFTFHGFRYLEVTGWPGGIEAIKPGDLTAVVIHAELEPIGSFRCSDALVAQLHQNVIWGMRGNFLAVPTDCPQRDERLGWTGDISAFAPTACYLYDVQEFLSDWLVDLELEQQHNDDVVPVVIPNVLKKLHRPEDAERQGPTAMWADAAVWVPWALWQAYGDDAVLRRQFDSMAAHARRVRTSLSANGLWDTGFQFGDWLDPDAPPDNAAAAKADKGVVSTACAFRTARLVSETAAVLGRPAEQEEFAAMASALADAFTRHYVHADRRILSDCPTVYAIAIAFGLLDAEGQAAAGQRLAQLVEESGFHIGTGFIGTPFVLDALSVTGHLDHAYRLLLQTTCPSWLYPVTMGATTVWERWDSLLPDGSINPGQMTSFNHYAYGAVGDWLHRTVGGLSPLEPGYRRILVAPRPGGGITWAETALKTPAGPARVRWSLDGGAVSLDVTIPDGATGVLAWPGHPEAELASGAHHFDLPEVG